MTPHAWDLHKRTYCTSCRYGRRCSAVKIMDKNPQDRQCAGFFVVGRDTHCSQYVLDPKREKK